jgi:hypothetical protein
LFSRDKEQHAGTGGLDGKYVQNEQRQDTASNRR